MCFLGPVRQFYTPKRTPRGSNLLFRRLLLSLLTNTYVVDSSDPQATATSSNVSMGYLICKWGNTFFWR